MDATLKQRVEIIAQDVEVLKAGGGGSPTTDAYTKAESDEKFLTKSAAAQNYQPKGTYAQIGDITSAINALDVETTTTSGYYIKSIAQTDGKISAVAESIDTTPTENSTHPITSGAVYSVVGDINTVLEEVL